MWETEWVKDREKARLWPESIAPGTVSSSEVEQFAPLTSSNWRMARYPWKHSFVCLFWMCVCGCKRDSNVKCLEIQKCSLLLTVSVGPVRCVQFDVSKIWKQNSTKMPRIPQLFSQKPLSHFSSHFTLNSYTQTKNTIIFWPKLRSFN